MSTFASADPKLRYYEAAGVTPALAKRYLREFANARTILDVGCGTGDFGRYCHRVDVHGVDVDARAVALAQRFEKAICVDLERGSLPYENGAFDAVLAKDVLEHLQFPARVVNEIRRVLQPGGVVVASVVMNKPRAVWSDYTHVRGFSRSSAAALFEDAGFEVEAVWRMGPFPGARRLNAIDLVPHLLKLPVVGFFWATSWELVARKSSDAFGIRE